MKTGAIIFAQNNSGIDYTKLAVFAASRIIEHLQIPVSLITDNPKWLLSTYPDHQFEQIIEIPGSQQTQEKKFYDGSLSSRTLEWKNLSRSQVYNLSPYDRTLVIDSDYILNSDILRSALDNDYDFQIYKDSFDLAFERDNTDFLRINKYSVPFYWATAFIFQKNTITEAFFDLVAYIKANWPYFRLLYNISNPLYRNDFAFSIAIHIMNGKTNSNFAVDLPGKMVYATDEDILITANGNKMKFLTQKKNHLGEYLVAKTTGMDVHVINKISLGRFIDTGLGI